MFLLTVHLIELSVQLIQIGDLLQEFILQVLPELNVYEQKIHNC